MPLARQKRSEGTSEEPLQLLVSRADASAKIDERIRRGKEIISYPVQSWDALEEMRKAYYKWSDYNTELLRRLFSNGSLAEEYSRYLGGFVSVGGAAPSLQEELNDFHKDVLEKIHRLDSIGDRLELIPEPQGVKREAQPSSGIVPSGRKVFVVHGHDEGARESVARFLERLGLEPIILHEQANAGQTIIEKLERNADVDFAVVLLTPDDVGAVASSTKQLRPRARQNVILELGYFVARLGRSRVCALHKGDVELPSDFLGVVYVPMDHAGGWRLLLAKELREASFKVDLNAAM